MKALQKYSLGVALLLATSHSQAIETILVDFQPADNGGSTPSEASNFQSQDSLVSSTAPVNVYTNIGDLSVNAVGQSTGTYPLSATTNVGGGYNAGAEAWNDLTPISEGYFYSFGDNTVTINGLSSAFVDGEEVTLTVYAIGDNLNQQTVITPSYGGVTLSAGSKSTVYNGVSRDQQDSASRPSVQWKFPVNTANDSISFEWKVPTGADNAALNGFSITSAPPAYGTAQSVTVTPETSTLLFGTPDLQLNVLSSFSTIGTVDTSGLPDFTTYSVTPSGVVEVSEFGLVSLVGAGSATVTVTITGDTGGSLSETANLTVELPTAISAALATDAIFIGGGSTDISVTANSTTSFTNFPLDGLPNLTFQSDNPDVATVGFFDGKVDAGITPGTATITASYPDGLGGQLTSSVLINVSPITEKPLTLLHRYAFNDAAGPAPASTVLTDSIGGLDGVVIGDDATFTGTSLALPGGVALSTAAYGDLPNGIISSLPQAATFETWVTINSSNGQERIFDFGSNSGGEGGIGTGETFLNLIAKNPFNGDNPS
ncbi:hypothetical protein N9891_02145, partial [bacterium]|nr:hypothetical protein [bacterium]